MIQTPFVKGFTYLKKEFIDPEYAPRKCKVCGSEKFEFILDAHVETGNVIANIGYDKCKKCGAK